GSEQKPSIRGQQNATCALERVRRTFLATDRLENTRTSATGGDALHLGKRAICRPVVVDNGVADLVRLNVQMSGILNRHTHLRHSHVLRFTHFCSPLYGWVTTSLFSLTETRGRELASPVSLWAILHAE